MACVTAWRITGSPERVTRRFSTPFRSLLVESICMMRPVSISAQVEALTNMESLSPRCALKSASRSLSLISMLAVSESGMRSSASARHISTTPSLLESS